MKVSEVAIDAELIAWKKSQPKPLSSAKKAAYEKEMFELVAKDLQAQLSMDVKENTLFHKYHELQEWLPKQDVGTIKWVEKLIWKPQGKSDYRRVQPELILVDGHYEVESLNIWGESNTEIYDSADELSTHWEVLRVLVSRARYDRFPGRTLNFLVRDKGTKKYLGVISITSDMLDLSARNKAIGADISKFTRDGNPFNLTANGQTIVPTQPFGSAFLGGKLLALLCLSKEVSDAWEKTYGDKLVGVTTTSLYGDTGRDGRTQYDGLTPYWKKMGPSEGTVPIKMTDKVFDEVREWIRICHPEQFFRDSVQTHKDSKNKLQRFAYKTLGLVEGIKSKHIRNVYFSRLYKNTDEYIQRHIASHYDPTVKAIKKEELIPAFDNSIEALTEHWKFGFATDTTTSPKSLVKQFGPDLRRLTKGRIDKNYKDKMIPVAGSAVEWYEELATFRNWEQAKKQFQNSDEN